MKKQKMSLERMRNVLSNVLSREEMKEVLAGSGGGGQWCGACINSYNQQPEDCYIQSGQGCRGCGRSCS